MAPKKSTKKHYPVVKSSSLANSSGAPQANRVVLVDRMLSKLNRRLYRQGRFYKVKVDIDTTQGQTIEVFALRDDWAVHKAYQMAFKAYRSNSSEEREALAPGQVARWEDFRVDDGLAGDIVDPNLHDVAGTPVAMTTGEFELATVTNGAGTRHTFTWGTPGGTEFGLLQEYDKYANAPTSPTDVVGSSGDRMPYGDLDTSVDDNMALDLQQHGDNPPYDRAGLTAGNPLVKIAELNSASSGVQKLSTGYFTAPCGIIFITNVGAASNDPKISFEVASGDYKGVHAPSMLE